MPPVGTASRARVRDILCVYSPLFAAKMRDGIVGNRGDFGIGVGGGKRRHGRCRGTVRSAGALEDHTDQIGPLRVADGVRTGEIRPHSLLAISVPAMTTRTSALEDAAANAGAHFTT